MSTVLLGLNEGRSSKFNVKFPCSPQTEGVGEAVTEVLLALLVDTVDELDSECAEDVKFVEDVVDVLVAELKLVLLEEEPLALPLGAMLRLLVRVDADATVRVGCVYPTGLDVIEEGPPVDPLMLLLTGTLIALEVELDALDWLEAAEELDDLETRLPLLVTSAEMIGTDEAGELVFDANCAPATDEFDDDDVKGTELYFGGNAALLLGLLVIATLGPVELLDGSSDEVWAEDIDAGTVLDPLTEPASSEIGRAP